MNDLVCIPIGQVYASPDYVVTRLRRMPDGTVYCHHPGFEVREKVHMAGRSTGWIHNSWLFEKLIEEDGVATHAVFRKVE